MRRRIFKSPLWSHFILVEEAEKSKRRSVPSEVEETRKEGEKRAPS